MKVLFAEYLTWDTPYRVGSHYYAQHFLDLGWDVGWLGGEFHLWNLVNNRAALRRKFKPWISGGVQHAEGPWEYVPLKLVPYRDMGPLSRPALAWRGKYLTLPSIRRILEQNDFGRADLLWLSNPQAYPWLIDEPGYARIIYRAADNHALSVGIPASVAAIEARIAQTADAVFVVHPDSLERFRLSAPERTLHMPNGVNLIRFSGAPPRPPEYSALTGPIAVYVGSINYRFDATLLAEVALRRPDITFVLIGEPVIDVARLRSVPNVMLLGPRSPECVPAYLCHAQVGLIPFVDLPATRELLSIKIYEYAASGLATVHATMSSVGAARLPVLPAPDVESFCDALDCALLWTSTERDAARAFAAANSWDDRYRRIDDISGGLVAKPVILLLEVLPDIKGGQQMLLEIVPALTAFDVHAVLPGQGPLYDALVPLNVTCHVVPMYQYTLVRKGFADVIAFGKELNNLSSRVAAIAKAIGARLLWANSSRAFVWGTLAARRARLPIVWHAQNLLVDRKSIFLTRIMARMSAVHRIVGCSASAAAQYNLPTRSSIVPLAVDLTQYRPSPEERASARASLGISVNQFVVAQVGDLIPLKGQSLVVQAARSTPEVLYLIIGEARDDQVESVRYAAQLRDSAGGNVRFLGRRSDVPRLLSASDVLAITSTQEAGPRVLVEGMACGLPVISTRVGMAPDVISPGEVGYLIDAVADSLVAILRNMAADPQRTREMGRRARELAERELGIDPYRQRMRAIVEDSLRTGN